MFAPFILSINTCRKRYLPQYTLYTYQSPSIIPANITHLIIEEDEVHLDENEGHSRSRCESEHDIVALGITFELEVLSKFEAGIDHRADTKRHCAHPKVEASVVLSWSGSSQMCTATCIGCVAVRTDTRRRLRRVQVAHFFLLLCEGGKGRSQSL